jgi:1,4-dihydroxy-2-naphthoate octaprenyltransferase
MVSDTVKSVITCDLEGRIETYNKGAEQIFGYDAEEVIGKKRVSLFSPGLIVLGHVNDWLKEARENGEFKGETVFVRKDGSQFTADIRITPTFRKVNGAKQQMGYCGVTKPRYDIPVEAAMPRVGLSTRIFSWLVVTRAPFLTATIIPVMVAAAWVVAQGQASPFPWGLFTLTMLGGIALHIAANTFNDYFDWRSGTDPINNDYFLPYSGGSRSIELGLITPQALLRLAFIALGIAALFGLVLAALGRPLVLVFGLVGAFSTYFYTAPPLRLAAHKGWGEFLIGLNFGILLVGGTVYTLTGTVSLIDFLLGVPIGFLITAILWINQFPDYEADKATGKNNLVVVLGLKNARWGYLLLLVGAFGILLFGVLAGALPLSALLTFLALPIGVYTTLTLFRHYADRSLIKANAYTIMLHVAVGLLLVLGLLLSGSVINLVM